jgi:hypothetical protein
MQPQFYSGKRATFEKHEADLLRTLRKFADTYFSEHDGVSKELYSALSKAKSQQKDFDCVVKIVSVHEMDEYTNELKVSD